MAGAAPFPEWLEVVAIRGGAGMAALAVGAIFLAATGHDPWRAYREMMIGALGSPFAIEQTIIKAIPLMLTGLGVALAFTMGLWNIGAEGQLVAGALAASWLALTASLPTLVMLPGLILLGAAGGAAWAFIPAVLKTFVGVNEIISTLMLNYIALLWVDYMVFGSWADPTAFSFPYSRPFPPQAHFPVLLGDIHIGLVLALIAALLLAGLLQRTHWGYEIRTIGASLPAARYAGMRVRRNVLLVMAASGALGGLAERSGVLNLGVEGMMLVGAVSGFAVAAVTGNPWLAVLGAMAAGGALAAGHALLTVTLGTEQVTTGLSLALFGTGLSAFLGKPFIGIPNPVPFRPVPLPGLAQLPILGPVFFRQDLLVYTSYVFIILAWWWIYRTRPGLHLRACGESPETADAMGVDVTAMRYGAVIVGGALAGLAGGYLSLAYTPAWTENMTAGLGWIAIALVIFSTWNPLRLLGGAYLFGAADALGFRVQLLGVETSSILLRMLPYLFTLVVLVLINAVRRHSPVPRALGRPYFREE